MKLALNNSDTQIPESLNDIHVLVAYEDFAAGDRALGVLKRVGCQCEGPGRLIRKMWRFDVLAEPGFFTFAVRDALAADIIVIAAHEGEPLPQRIRDWIARWLLMKEERPRALVASIDRNWAKPWSPEHVLPYLEKVAFYGKMQFFANGSGGGTEVDSGGVTAEATRRTETGVGELLLRTSPDPRPKVHLKPRTSTQPKPDYEKQR